MFRCVYTLFKNLKQLWPSSSKTIYWLVWLGLEPRILHTHTRQHRMQCPKGWKVLLQYFTYSLPSFDLDSNQAPFLPEVTCIQEVYEFSLSLQRFLYLNSRFQLLFLKAICISSKDWSDKSFSFYQQKSSCDKWKLVNLGKCNLLLFRNSSVVCMAEWLDHSYLVGSKPALDLRVRREIASSL